MWRTIRRERSKENVIHNTADRSTVVSNSSASDAVASGKTAFQTMRGFKTEKALATWFANEKINPDQLKLATGNTPIAARNTNGGRAMIPRKALTDGETQRRQDAAEYTWLFPRHTEA
jgi:hypothetical protein